MHGFKNLGKNTTFASKKEIAWHGLGKTVDAMTSKEAMELGGLNFEVGKAPLFAATKQVDFWETPDIDKTCITYWPTTKLDTEVEVTSQIYLEGSKLPNNFATYRKDTEHVFGIVGSRYEVIQNYEAFEFFDSIIGEGHAKYETVGALGNGEVIFITAKLPGELVVNKENIDKYLLLTMAHDGSSSIRVMFTPIRVVCNNTLQFAISKATNKVSIRHTKNARDKLDLAKRILGVTTLQSKLVQEVFDMLAKTEIKDNLVSPIIETAFNFKRDENNLLSTKASNKIAEIGSYYYNGIGQKDIVGTGWGVI